jgi:hypothetical protein
MSFLARGRKFNVAVSFVSSDPPVLLNASKADPGSFVAVEVLGNLKLTCLLESCSLGVPNKDEALVVSDKGDLAGVLPLPALSSSVFFVESSLSLVSFVALEEEPNEITGLMVAVEVVVIAVEVAAAVVGSSLGLSAAGGAPKVNVFF